MSPGDAEVETGTPSAAIRTVNLIAALRIIFARIVSARIVLILAQVNFTGHFTPLSPGNSGQNTPLGKWSVDFAISLRLPLSERA